VFSRFLNMAIQEQAVNVVIKHTLLEFHMVEEVAVVRARSKSDFFTDYADLENVDFSKIGAPLSDCSTAADSDSDGSSSSHGCDSEDSSSKGRFSDRQACGCPPGVLSWPAVQPCVFLQPVVHVPFPVRAGTIEVQQKGKPQVMVQDGMLTSIMLRNIPNNLKRDALLELFDSLGFRGLYDFVYLPIDFSRNSNVGYAFINLVNATAASKFQATLHGFHGWTGSSRKVCEAVWSQLSQGLACHVDRYRNSPVMHADVPDECRPVLFKDGKRIEFPAPTKPLKRPKMRTSSAKCNIKISCH